VLAITLASSKNLISGMKLANRRLESETSAGLQGRRIVLLDPYFSLFEG
jgi:hypothetical protein